MGPASEHGSGAAAGTAPAQVGSGRSAGTAGSPGDVVNVRYLVDDVEAALAWYTAVLGFEPSTVALPAFADVRRGALRLLLSGPSSSAGRAMTDGTVPSAGGWNRIQLLVEDLDAEVARLQSAGVRLRNEVVRGPGGAQVLLVDPAGNLVELFQPAAR